MEIYPAWSVSLALIGEWRGEFKVVAESNGI
jgi:hypothetical protein